MTAVQVERPQDTASQPVAYARCDACPHPTIHHDAIGLRFCRATKSSAMDRGCVCRTG